ncbi:MAG: hypothetical protein O9296_13735 [Novosphingobium sp.]|nr:hypothetical protein [Novosphingobium sp.]
MHTIQMLGLIGAASYLAARAARGMGTLAWHRYAILAQPRAGLPVMPRGYAVRELAAAELAGLVQAGQAVDASAAVRAERFAAGLTCLGVFDRREALTGLVWLGQGTYREDEVAVRFVIPPRCCWDTGLWIAPEHRMGRSFAALWAGVGQWMDARGLRHSLSRVADYNLPALTAHRRMGAQVLSHRSFLRIGGWQWAGEAQPRLVRLGPAGAAAELDLGPLAAGLG